LFVGAPSLFLTRNTNKGEDQDEKRANDPSYQTHTIVIHLIGKISAKAQESCCVLITKAT